MILGFKKQFVTPIISGKKIHTIREDKNDRWKKNNLIHFATGVRTKNYNHFRTGLCFSVQKIEIKYRLGFNNEKLIPSVFIDEKKIVEGLEIGYSDYPKLVELINNDGFELAKDFFNWFNKDFKGKIPSIKEALTSESQFFV